MSEPAIVAPSPWYRSLDRTQWKALVASNLGWIFDGFEVFALILTVGVALHQLLDPSQHQFIPSMPARSSRSLGRAARRRACGLSWPQALDDPDHPRLFAAHRLVPAHCRLPAPVEVRAEFSAQAAMPRLRSARARAVEIAMHLLRCRVRFWHERDHPARPLRRPLL
jgi:hypothetical protein